MTERATPFAGLGDRTEALLHYIPFLSRTVAATADDDPQEHEDEHVKDVKKRVESQHDNGC